MVGEVYSNLPTWIQDILEESPQDFEGFTKWLREMFKVKVLQTEREKLKTPFGSSLVMDAHL